MSRGRIGQDIVKGQNHNAPPDNEFTYKTFDEWYKVFVFSAGAVKPGLASEDGSLIDFMDHTPLKRAYADKVDPIALGASFGEDFDIEKFGK